MELIHSGATEPDELLLQDHLERGAFQIGVDRRRWRVERIAWPYAFFLVAAAPRLGAPTDYAFRLQLDNYPVDAPIGRCWDPASDQPLSIAKRPWGVGRVGIAFRTDWQSDSCLYLPCDRMALIGHDGWRALHPSMVWTSSSDVTLYLRTLHDLLHSRDYTGIRGS
jgi:hypothetical protein